MTTVQLHQVEFTYASGTCCTDEQLVRNACQSWRWEFVEWVDREHGVARVVLSDDNRDELEREGYLERAHKVGQSFILANAEAL